MTTNAEAPSVSRVMVATDRSETADRAVRWAANVASAYGAELLLLQVLPGADMPEVALSLADEELRRFAEEIAGARAARWSSSTPPPRMGKMARRGDRAKRPPTSRGGCWAGRGGSDALWSRPAPA